MTQLLPNILAIPIPGNARDFCFIEITKDRKAVQWTFDSGNGLSFVPETGSYILLSGSYEIMFATKGATEEQAAGVVERLAEQVLSTTHVLGYKAYNNEKIWKNGYLSNYPFRTATESLQSLLKSKGLMAGNYLIIKKKS